MKFICLTLLLVSGITDSRSEQYTVVGPADPVFAVPGEEVILPCSVKPSISVVDMRVEWFRLDLIDTVHLYEDHEDRNTDQIQSYRGRTKLIHQELQRGNASLKLSTVQISDKGLYKCLIRNESWSADVTVDVRVEAEAVGRPPVITVDGFDRSGGLHLQCESEGWYPEPDLEWMDSEGVSLSSETPETHRNSVSNRFSVKHTITVYESNKKIHCRVKLRHHMLETLIISSNNMFISWRTSVILILVIVVLVVIAGILIAAFVHKNRAIDQLPDEHRTLQNEHRTLQNEHRTLLDEHRTLLDEHRTLQNEHRTLPNEKRTLQNEKRTLLDEHGTLQDEKRTLLDEHGTLQDEKRTLLDEHRTLQNEHRTLQNEHWTLQNEHRTLQNEHRTLQNEKRRIQHERDQLLQSQKIIFPKAVAHLRTNTVNVTLDADTAHKRLIVSHDEKQVRCGNTLNAVDGGKHRFDDYLGVLGKDGFSSGSFYFEVQVKEQTQWDLGVTRESSNRKGLFSLSPDDGYWTVRRFNEKYCARDSSPVSLSLSVEPQRIGVFVDYEKGLVFFYDVESMSHIYTYTDQSFKEKLYPCVGLGYWRNENSTPLIICDD